MNRGSGCSFLVVNRVSLVMEWLTDRPGHKIYVVHGEQNVAVGTLLLSIAVVH